MKMIFHRLYRQTMTQLNAINEIVDHLRSQGLYTIRPDSRRVKIERALKVLEARAEILRARAAQNRSSRRRQSALNPQVEFCARCTQEMHASSHWGKIRQS